MEALTQANIDTVTEFLTGKRLEKFLESVGIVQESLATGEWSIKRARGKAFKGINQGLTSKAASGSRGDNFDVYMCVAYGSPVKAEIEATEGDFEAVGVKPEIVRAWIEVCREIHSAAKILDNARPKPKLTAIQLSPKVTKTLTEMNLDLDLSTIKPAEIIKIEYSEVHPVTFQPVNLNRRGEVVTTVSYQVEWSKGISHGTSRFSHCDCEACGKKIPSQLVVPVEVHDRKRDGLISLWLGRDCASNIFGVKDVGIKR